jgi:cell division protein FtsB
VTIKAGLNQAYRQAPWRQATQKGVLFLILALLGASILWIMLTVTIQAGSAGLQIQDYERRQEELIREIASLHSDIALSTSASVMEDRALKLGYHMATPDEITYIIIPGYAGRQTDISAPPPSSHIPPLMIKPGYTQSLSEWLLQGIYSLSEKPGGLIQ